MNLVNFHIYLVILVFFLLQIDSGSASELNRLLMENDEISVLVDYKDSPEIIKLKLKNLQKINKSRKIYGLRLLRFDILASRVSNKHCLEMLKYDYLGHQNKDGFKPYHRYAFAGGTDHVGENLYSQKITGASFSTDRQSILEKMSKGHNEFMAENPPYDGHKKEIIKPDHTHVGIGYAIDSRNFRYAQLFVDRYVDVNPLPHKITKKDQLSFKGTMLKSKRNYGPYALIIYYEPIPEKFDYKNQPGFYTDYTNATFLTLPPWKIKFNKQDRTFKINMDFWEARKGLYYVVLYVRDRLESIPYIPRPGKFVSMNTKEAIPVTGMIIEVQ
ncbi:putative SCP domain-containing protein [Candidatus Magnetomoraceae bacterium gMMP-15]